MGFALGDSVQMAWEGDEEAGFKGKLDKLRAIGAIYPNYIQIVASAESGIKTLEDLKGKRIATNRGSIGHQVVLAALEEAGDGLMDAVGDLAGARGVSHGFLLGFGASAAASRGAAAPS